MSSKVAVCLVAVIILTNRAFAQDSVPGKAKSPESNVKVKVEVELRGVLSFAEKEVTLVVQESEFNPNILAEVPKERKWLVVLGEAEELQKKAKSLHGKTVIIKGSATLLGINTQTFKYKGSVPAIYVNPPLVPPDMIGTRTVLNLEHKVEVKSLTEATRK
jgi:hypothetical protein